MTLNYHAFWTERLNVTSCVPYVGLETTSNFMLLYHTAMLQGHFLLPVGGTVSMSEYWPGDMFRACLLSNN